MKQKFDVIVIGGGHAGVEASLSAARMDRETLLVTLNRAKIAEMSCNPSIGGVGKGQLVKEIDALGGEMGKIADVTGIQFKRLNTRKGSAVQSSRCQSDKNLYASSMREVINRQPRLTVSEGEVKGLILDGNQVMGISLEVGGLKEEVYGAAVVITAGTFMHAVMHCGGETKQGGRFGESSSEGLSSVLADAGFTLLRLKTGTPARLKRESIDFSKMKRQEGDNPPRRFSFSDTKISLPQVSCYIGATNTEVHKVIRENLDRSPLFSGQIKGIGPRYCPSIEDKVVKFPQKTSHQLFFEPETLSSDSIYPNGISTSLPKDVQERFVRAIVGCEEAQFIRYGYAVEYDCIDPTQLMHTLESKKLKGLFFAGQVNGTSGYEEAAAQGLLAGINAALSAEGREGFTLSRSESYIGVMVDDLVRLGVTEPYRMFTSRAEFRLFLREDNADLRLRKYGHTFGLVNQEEFERVREKSRFVRDLKSKLEKTFITPSPAIQEVLSNCGSAPLSRPENLLQIIKRPNVGLMDIKKLFPDLFHVEQNIETIETAEVEFKFEGYLRQQEEEIEKLKKLEFTKIPSEFEYDGIPGLSIELREKLKRLRPSSLADAAKLPGVTPAALSVLLFSIRRSGGLSARP